MLRWHCNDGEDVCYNLRWMEWFVGGISETHAPTEILYD